MAEGEIQLTRLVSGKRLPIEEVFRLRDAYLGMRIVAASNQHTPYKKLCTTRRRYLLSPAVVSTILKMGD